MDINRKEINKYEKLFKEVTGYEFSRYYLENRPKLTYYLFNKFTKGDNDKASDFADQAFIQALEKIETYDSNKSKLITWLTKIAINLVIKDWKDNHKYNFISFERDTTEAPSIMNILHYEDNLEDSIKENENKKKCEIVYDVITGLQDKYKKVMVMRELNNMAYRDIAEAIKKDTKININGGRMKLDNPEDFYTLELNNIGNGELKVDFSSENGDVFTKIISSKDSLNITRNDIYWNRNMTDLFYIDSTLTKTTGVYTTTTNLSTIKSQIKKGRELIKKKVKKRFDMINENGVENFNF